MFTKQKQLLWFILDNHHSLQQLSRIDTDRDKHYQKLYTNTISFIWSMFMISFCLS